MCDSIKLARNITKYKIYLALAGFSTLGPLINLYYLAADISYSQLSLIEISSLIILVLLEVPTGVLSDLLGRKLSLFIAAILMGLELILIGLGHHYSLFILAAFIGGIGISLESGADDAILYDSLKALKQEEQFQKIIGQANAIFKVSAAISGVFWGYIYQINPSLVFILCGLLLIGSGFFSLTMFEASSLKKSDTNHTFTPSFKPLKILLLRSYCILKNHQGIWGTILFASLLCTSIRAHTSVLRPSLLDNSFSNTSYIGLVLALGFMISSLASWYAHRITALLSPSKILILLALVSGSAFILMGYSNTITLVLSIYVILALNTYMGIFISDYWHQKFPSRQRCTLISFISSSESTIGIITLFAAGLLVDYSGLTQSTLFMGGFILCLPLLLLSLEVKPEKSAVKHPSYS